MHKLFLIISLMVACLTAKANSIDTLFNTTIPTQEKVYLHLDNNWYFAGDTIWYKAYTVRADNNRPSPLSRILYVELLNEQGFLVERQQLVIDYDGHSHGQFCLSDTAFAGYYELRAYTKWMLNFAHEPVEAWLKNWVGKEFHGISQVDWWTDPAWQRGKHLQELKGKGVDPNPTRLEKIIIGGPKITQFDSKSSIESEIEKYIKDASLDKSVAKKDYREYGNLFSRVVPVYQKPEKPKYFRRKLMPVKVTMGDYKIIYENPDFDAKFYPEGGYLLTGHECRVGWEAINKYGQRLNASGVLLEDGNEIAEIKPTNSGRGDFRFTPRKGSNYKVRFTYDGDKHTFSLPEAKKEGYALAVLQEDDSVAFRIARNVEAPKTIYLSVTCKGKMVDVLSVDFSGDETLVKLPKSKLPTGVNQATLFEDANTVYADRLFFVREREDEKARLTINGVKASDYTENEKISLSLKLTDRNGMPLEGQRFSLAVRDESQTEETFCTGNVMTELLLQSDIRGFVENPDYYFIDDSEKRNQALDLLMMIQGWRRYDWKDVSNAKRFKPEYMPEQTTAVTGQAYDLRNLPFSKRKGEKEIFCSLLMLDDNRDSTMLFQGKEMADEKGFFGFSIPPFYGKAKLVLRGKYQSLANKKDYATTLHDASIFIRKDFFHPVTTRALSWYETNKPDFMPSQTVSWEDYQKGIYSAVILPEVRIKRKNRQHFKRNKFKPVQRIDFLDFVNDVYDRTFYDYRFKLNNNEINLHYIARHMLDHVRHRYHNAHERIYLSFDWNINKVKDMLFFKRFLPKLSHIEFVTDDPHRPVDYTLKHLDRHTEMDEKGGVPPYGISAYVNIVSMPKGKERLIHGREYNLQGFNRPAEFYNPDYSKIAMPKVKDYRKTLYWNPNVTTDKDGKATIEFYNNSVASELNISAEGITKDGKFIISGK